MSHAAAPYFSLIVPVYKVERFLQDALNSVHEQTFTDYEALCVDDGSPDGSGTILDEAARVNPRFRPASAPPATVPSTASAGNTSSSSTPTTPSARSGSPPSQP